MKRLTLVALLVASGCSAFTPAEVQNGVAKLNRDLPLLRAVIASVSTNQKLLADLDLVTSNVSAMDQIVNH